MSSRSDALERLPSAVSVALARLGADLAVARKRRKQSLRAWAPRLNVSVPTLMKLEKGEDEDTPLIEHAAMTLAARCGIDVATTRALPVRGRHAVAVRRFDRLARGARVHAISAHVALRAVGEAFGYPDRLGSQRRAHASTSAP